MHHHQPGRLIAQLLIVATGVCCQPAAAQQSVPTGAEIEDGLAVVGGTKADAEKKPEAKSDLLIVPIPQASPSLGFGAVVTASMFYNPNQSKEPWITGVGVMRTSNKSWAVGALHKMSFEQDRFRLGLFAGYGDINMDFYGIGSSAGNRDRSIGLNEKGYAAAAQGQVRVAPNLYLGARALLLDLSTRVRHDDPQFPDAEIPTAQFDSRLVKVGPAITYDRRDNSLSPSNGELVNAFWLFGIRGLGGDYTHNKFTLNGAIYRRLGASTVIAGRASLCVVSGGAPFYDLCMYGSSSDLRGYEAGRYRDGAYWAAQLELRQKLSGRFGAVAFAGIGESTMDLSHFGKGKFLPAGGAGLRYQPSKETPINLRVDFALGKDSRALYIGIGEAF